MTLKAGSTLGGWTVDRVLAYGEPTLVAAHRTDAPAQRATLRVTAGRDAEKWMRRELTALKSMDDPRIPRPMDAATVDGACYIAVRPFSGDLLGERMVAGDIDWRRAVFWLYDLASALQHIHAQGWVHRSVNPQSVYIGPNGEVWLMGFEYAVRDDERIELDTGFSRSLAYVAPEVLREPAVHSVRADLYSFGLVAYELLSGEEAFPPAAWAEQRNREAALLQWKARATARDPGPGVPGWLRSLVQKCTHPISDMRLPDMESVIAWLEASRPSWDPIEQEVRVSEPRAPHPSTSPSIDGKQLAAALAARDQAARRDREMMVVSMSGMLGIVAGLFIAVLAVLAIELSKV